MDVMTRRNEGFEGEGMADSIVGGGSTLQQTRTSYCTAVSVQKPRVIKDVARRLIEEAALAGEEFYYGWGAGKDSIEGPSVKLALALGRCWGNCAVETLPVQDLPDAWIFTAAFVDLETGFTISRQFRQSKNWRVFGKLDDERKDDIRFQIGQSKAVRNVMLNALPSSLVTQALQAAKSGVRSRIEDLVKQHGLPKAIDIALKALLKSGVKEPAVLRKFGVQAKKDFTVDHLVTIKGDLNAIEQGQERAEELYPALAEKPNGAKPEAPAAEPKQEPDPLAAAKANMEEVLAKQEAAPADPLPILPDPFAKDRVDDLATQIEALADPLQGESIRNDILGDRAWIGDEACDDLNAKLNERLEQLSKPKARKSK